MVGTRQRLPVGTAVPDRYLSLSGAPPPSPSPANWTPSRSLLRATCHADRYLSGRQAGLRPFIPARWRSRGSGSSASPCRSQRRQLAGDAPPLPAPGLWMVMIVPGGAGGGRPRSQRDGPGLGGHTFSARSGNQLGGAVIPALIFFLAMGRTTRPPARGPAGRHRHPAPSCGSRHPGSSPAAPGGSSPATPSPAGSGRRVQPAWSGGRPQRAGRRYRGWWRRGSSSRRQADGDGGALPHRGAPFIGWCGRSGVTGVVTPAGAAASSAVLEGLDGRLVALGQPERRRPPTPFVSQGQRPMGVGEQAGVAGGRLGVGG